ncbi:MAG: hypothetical protein CMH53_02915, partial [Myxococcales bacterium]|nr:hypothetical protein [Myxococcales bacterium]
MSSCCTWKRLLTVALVFAVASCGDSAGDNNNKTDGSVQLDASVSDAGLADTAAPDDSASTEDSASSEDSSTAADTSAEDTSSATDTTQNNCPGAEDCPCQNDDECDSKVCAAPADGGDTVCQPACKPTEPADEVCDGVDNDCDGKTDNDTCDDGNVCTTNACEKAADDTYGCSVTPANGGTTCDDGDACTSNDACADGKCTGDTVDCDDSNPCTDDSCDATNGCANTNNTATCDDGDVCTDGEGCADGKCAGGTTKNCDDGNTCTKDSCDATNGCLNDNDDTGTCDDGDSCSEKDTCSGGACTAGSQKDCDDNNACTTDVCNSQTGSCDNTAIQDGGACDDGDLCTDTDSCVAGKCAGSQKTCDDSDPCTADSCDAAKGCVNTSKAGGACDDGNPCTDKDACDQKGCTGTLKTCDDGSPCTTDSCDPNKGCVTKPVDGACDDGSKCTSVDTCVDGSCTGKGVKDCDDNNPCTIDGCDAPTGECSHKAQTGKCDDGSKCTEKDACTAGKCTGAKIKCDDSNPCTTDSCDPSSGCKNNANNDKCDDGNACTAKDVCANGKCAGKDDSAKKCDDSNPCTKDSCDPKIGCKNDNDDKASCDDGDACTAKDVCKGGKCQSGANTCQCKTNEDCKDDGNKCNGSPVCKNNKCVTDLATVVSCDSSKDTLCLVNTCAKDSGKCAPQPANDGNLCKDGNPCTLGNTCAKGKCKSGEKPKCNDGNACTKDSCDVQTGKCNNVATDGCIPCKDASVCDDKNACTKDACVSGKCASEKIAGCSLSPDLVTAKSITFDKTKYTTGDTILVSYGVSNIGLAAAAARGDAAYLSTDKTFSKDDIQIGTLLGPSLGGKKLQQLTIKAKLPTTIKSGQYSIIVRVDAKNTVEEANELNNQVMGSIAVTAIPDLRLTVMKPDVSATFAGSKVTFSLKIDNISAVTAASSTAQFYLSKDAKINTTDAKPYKWTVQSLAAGKSWTGSKYVNIPANLESGTWYIGLRIDDTNSIKEGDEANNVLWVKVAVGPAPDLQAVSFSAFSKTMQAGNKYTLAASEKNIGDKDSSKYTSTIYLSSSTSVSKSSVKLLDIPRIGLKKNAALSFKPVVTIPGATKAGTYYLIFRVDSANSVAEKLESNNYKTTKIAITGRADLKSALLKLASKDLLPGAKGSVTYAETNIGTGDSKDYSVRFYLSNNNVYGPGDVALTSDIKRSALEAQTSSKQTSASFTIPVKTAPGKYYLIHRVDSKSGNVEADEKNNNGAVAFAVVSKPNLVISDISLGVKSTPAGVSFKSSYALENKGGTTAGASETRFYLSTDTTFGKGDLLIGKSTSGSIKGGGKAQLGVGLTIPATTKAGKYNVLIIADAAKAVSESNESDNQISVPLTVLAPKLPDLQLTAVALGSKLISFKPGAKVTLKVTAKNGGTVSTGAYGARAFLSTDGTITPLDTAVSNIAIKASLLAGKSTSYDLTVTIPLNTKPGNYFLGAYLDPSNQIVEILESNNTSKAVSVKVEAQADLFAVSVKTDKTYYKPGDTVSYTVNYSNLGTANAGSHTVSLRFSTNTVISPQDTELKALAVKTISAAKSLSLKGTFVLPKATKAGSAYIGAWIDSKNTIKESNESNNTTSTPVTIQNILVKKADLIPDAVKVTSSTVSAGKAITWSANEKNIGTAAAGAHSARVYLSKSSTSFVGALLLKNVAAKSLVAGASIN